MTGRELESLFFRPPASKTDGNAARRLSSDRYRPPPVRSDRAPYHLDLAAVLPVRAQEIADAGQLVFHVVGDTGGVNGTGAQISVAQQMGRQIHESELPDQPSFFY